MSLDSLVRGTSKAITIDDPDLLLVDLDFEKDERSPELDGSTDVDAVDPRGLLYGAIIAAYFLGAQGPRPFGFSIYSQHWDAALDDGYAQTFFGLLLALSGELGDDVSVDGVLKAMRERRAVSKPEHAVADALGRYRRSLWEALQNDLAADAKSFLDAALLVENACESNEPSPNLDTAVVMWTGARGGIESVLLRSLFADCRSDGTWSLDALGSENSNEEMGKVINFDADVCRPVEEYLDHLDSRSDDDAEPKWPFSDRLHEEKKVFALTLRWAQLYCRRRFRSRHGGDIKAPGVTEIAEWLGLQARQVNRAISTVIHRADSGGGGKAYLEALDSPTIWPFAHGQWIPYHVTKHLKARLAKNEDYGHIYRPPTLALGLD